MVDNEDYLLGTPLANYSLGGNQASLLPWASSDFCTALGTDESLAPWISSEDTADLPEPFSDATDLAWLGLNM